MIIGVDFDGTLVEHQYPAIGKPNKELIDKLKKLQEKGHKLILWTCRDKEELITAVKWCESIGLVFDAVNENLPEIKATFKNCSCKIFADIYVDDRNISIEQFVERY